MRATRTLLTMALTLGTILAATLAVPGAAADDVPCLYVDLTETPPDVTPSSNCPVVSAVEGKLCEMRRDGCP